MCERMWESVQGRPSHSWALWQLFVSCVVKGFMWFWISWFLYSPFGEIFDFHKKNSATRRISTCHKTTATCVRKLILQKCICDHVKGLLNQMTFSSLLTFFCHLLKPWISHTEWIEADYSRFFRKQECSYRPLNTPRSQLYDIFPKIPLNYPCTCCIS